MAAGVPWGSNATPTCIPEHSICPGAGNWEGSCWWVMPPILLEIGVGFHPSSIFMIFLRLPPSILMIFNDLMSCLESKFPFRHLKRKYFYSFKCKRVMDMMKFESHVFLFGFLPNYKLVVGILYHLQTFKIIFPLLSLYLNYFWTESFLILQLRACD